MKAEVVVYKRVDVKIEMSYGEACSLLEYLHGQPKKKRFGFSQEGQEEADLLEKALEEQLLDESHR